MSSGDQVADGTATPVRHRPTVTLAALYGAGGSFVGSRVAERLGVPLLDREIPAAVAEITGLSEEAVNEVDEESPSATGRIFERLGHAGTVTGGTQASGDLGLQERRLRGFSPR